MGLPSITTKNYKLKKNDDDFFYWYKIDVKQADIKESKF